MSVFVDQTTAFLKYLFLTSKCLWLCLSQGTVSGTQACACFMGVVGAAGAFCQGCRLRRSSECCGPPQGEARLEKGSLRGSSSLPAQMGDAGLGSCRTPQGQLARNLGLAPPGVALLGDSLEVPRALHTASSPSLRCVRCRPTWPGSGVRPLHEPRCGAEEQFGSWARQVLPGWRWGGVPSQDFCIVVF